MLVADFAVFKAAGSSVFTVLAAASASAPSKS